MKEIPVMYIMANIVDNINDQKCGVVNIEEHESCECRCPMRAQDCYLNGNQVLANYMIYVLLIFCQHLENVN